MAFKNSTLLRDHSIENGADSLLNSYDEGDESFVVLERSTANDFNLGLERSSLSQSFKTTQDDNSLSVFHNNLPNGIGTSFSNQANARPVETVDCSVATSVSAEEIDTRLKEVLHENIILKENLRQTNLAMKQQLNTMSLVQDRAVDAQRKQQLKFEETKALILKLGSEKNEVMEANEALTKEINKLKEDNKELTKTNFAFGEETSKLVSENAVLKTQLAALQDSVKLTSDSHNKSSLQPSVKEVELRETVEELTRKLEAVERSRRQQEFDVERLQAQLGRATTELVETQRKLALKEQGCKSLPGLQILDVMFPTSDTDKALFYEELLRALDSTLNDDETKLDSMRIVLSKVNPNLRLPLNDAELYSILSDEQKQKEKQKWLLQQAASGIKEMLGETKRLREELELLKAGTAVKESHSFAYEETKKKGYEQKIDELTATLVQKEEALGIAERHLASLQEAVRLYNEDKQGQDVGITQGLKGEIEALTKELGIKDGKIKKNEEEMKRLETELQKLEGVRDTVAVFEEQAKIYQADFEAERKSREALVAEKERILEDLRHLQRRNEDLLGEVNRARDELAAQHGQLAAATQQGHRAAEQSRHTEWANLPTAPPPRPAQVFVCPISNCNRLFSDQDNLNKHMFVCWGNQYTSTFSLPRKPKYGCNHHGCNQAFTTQAEYTLHLKFQHTDDNKLSSQQSEPYCHSCEQSFGNSRDYTNHLSLCAVNKDARQTAEQAYLYCPNCDYPFENEETLTCHVYSCWEIHD